MKERRQNSPLKIGLRISYHDNWFTDIFWWK